MFIPKGKAVHENLVTRYLLIDELAADLCESDFSGVVEITLRDSDNHMIFDQGKVAAVIEKSVGAGFSQTTVANLAKRARAERGRVSVFSYPSGVAASIAGRLAAEPLYTNLSTDFADLEKLVLKLLRENDREWFVEVFLGDSETLIHIVDEQYRIIASETPAEAMPHALEKPDTSPLHNLVDKCHRLGGTFDVYFRPAHRQNEPPFAPESAAALDQTVLDEKLLESENPIEELMSPSSALDELATEMDSAHDADEKDLPARVKEARLGDPTDLAIEIEDSSNPIERNGAAAGVAQEAPENLTDQTFAGFEAVVATNRLGEATDLESVNKAAPSERTPVATVNDTDSQDLPPRILPTRELMALPANFEGLAEAMKMADIRRLLGKIIKTIEEVNRVVEQKDNFQIHLRAGQLKVADLYPFLDPFGSEFEYLDGEVVFIGKVEPEEFVSGLTDALIYAVTEAAQASAQPLRLRSYIAEELKNLLDRNHEDFAGYKLDVAIKRIIGPQMWRQSTSEP